MTFREIGSLNQIKENFEVLQSIPPGCQNQTIKGIFNLRVQTTYLNTCRQSTGMKCKLWGMPGEGLKFDKISQTVKQVRLSVRSKLESLSKYFNDMKLFCIQIFTLLEQEKQIQAGLQKKHKVVKQNRQVGWIFINIQRYIINHTLSNFEQTVNIVDIRKQKIGEAKIIVTVQMFKQRMFQSSQLPPSVQMIQQIKKPAPSYFEAEKHFSENENVQEQQHKKRKIIPNRDPGYKNSVVQSIDYEKQFEKHRKGMSMENHLFGEIKRKGKAQLFLQQYQKNKPEHTELSIIRQKYGFNLPSVEIMKLKYDQVRLLSNGDQNVPKNEATLNLLLKSIKMQGKQKADFLMIYCQQKQKRLRTQTKLLLPEQASNQKMEINYLYTIPNNPLDCLVFQLKDAQYQMHVSDLVKMDKIQIKSRNGKRVCTIQFVLISEDGVKKSKLVQAQQINKKKNKQESGHNQKIKENAYISVLNWKQDKIALKNTNFGTVKASKLLFQISQPNSYDLSIQLEHQNKEKSVLQLNLNHLFKQQNYLVNGTSVKVITSRGQLAQILTLIEKLQPQKSTQNNKTKPVQQQDVESIETLKQLVKVYVNLEECQNVQCNQLLEELTVSHLLSSKKLEKFAAIINISADTLRKVLEIHFQSKFQHFYSSFRVFHDWNYKYKTLQKKLKTIISNDPIKHYLSKTVRKIKKSSELMFGLIPANFFINQFLKQSLQNEKSAGQNEIEHQQIGKLIVLIFERYFNRCIKISQLQEFIHENRSFVDLNIYLLFKLCSEIKNQKDQFNQYLNNDSENFLNIFDQKAIQSGEIGLAKLLLSSQEEYAQSSLISGDENLRKYTEDIMRRQTEFREEDQKNKTEQSRYPFNKERMKTEQEHSHRHKQLFQKQQHQQNQQKMQPKNITVVVKNAKILSETKINQIVLTSQLQTVTLSNQLLQFPRAIVLLENAVYNIEVRAQDDIYEGVFLASTETKRAKLYRKQKQCGYLQLFAKGNKSAYQQSQIVVKLTTEQFSHQIQGLMPEPNHIPAKYEEIAMNMDNSAKSPQIKMTVRSLRPTRIQFRLQITNQTDNETKYLNFPIQNQLILQNSPKGWKIKLINEQYEQISVLNQKGSNSYCFSNVNDQKVGYVAVIEIDQCWNPSPAINQSQSLHICLNLDEFISLNQFQSKIYNVVLQVEKDVFQIGSINNSSKNRKLYTQLSYVFKKQVNEITVKLIQNQTKSQVCSFKFMTKLIQKGIERSERFLFSDRDCYRLKISVFQVRYEWTYCKPDRLISLFTYPYKKTIQSFINQNPSIAEQRLIFWLKNSFQLTLGQIEILFNDVMGIQSGRYLQCLQRLFGNIRLFKIMNMSDILQQFVIFDLTEKGLVSQTQITLVKRILQKNFKQVYNYFERDYKKFLSSPEREGNFIVDLAKIQNNTDFDYLSFLSLFQDSLQIKQQPAPNKIVDQKSQKSKYLGLKLISFNKLSINGAPSTLLFKINGQKLAQPIHRCYSHTYHDLNEIVIKNEANQYLQIFCQRLSSQGNWEYKLIEKVIVSQQIKILGGTILFEIRQINEKGEEIQKFKRQNNHREQVQMPVQKQERKQNEEVNVEKQDDFSKSFWNKSLNETRQKWLNASKGGTGKKEARKLVNMDKEEIKKKMNFFNRQWDD